MKPFDAALKGARRDRVHRLLDQHLADRGIHSVAVDGRNRRPPFREFAVTLSTAILVSMVISLTTTPMMCAYLLKHEGNVRTGRFFWLSERFFDGMLSLYRVSLDWVLEHPVPTLVVLL